MGIADEQTPEKYAPIFPRIFNSFIAYFNKQNLGFPISTSEEITSSPSLVLQHLHTSISTNNDRAMVRSDAVLNNGSIMLVFYTPLKLLEDLYDKLVNVLHGWGAENGLMDLKITSRELYNLPGETQLCRVYIRVEFSYYDYTVDTTYPVIPHNKCGKYACQNVIVRAVEVTDVLNTTV